MRYEKLGNINLDEAYEVYKNKTLKDVQKFLEEKHGIHVSEMCILKTFKRRGYQTFTRADRMHKKRERSIEDKVPLFLKDRIRGMYYKDIAKKHKISEVSLRNYIREYLQRHDGEVSI